MIEFIGSVINSARVIMSHQNGVRATLEDFHICLPAFELYCLLVPALEPILLVVVLFIKCGCILLVDALAYKLKSSTSAFSTAVGLLSSSNLF